MKTLLYPAALLIASSALFPLKAQAWPWKVDVTDGAGDEMAIHHRLFGRQDVTVKDRTGKDSFNYHKGFFNKKVQSDILDNKVDVRSMPFYKKVGVQDMLGDQVSFSHPFMFTTGKINLSGIDDLLEGHSRPKSIPYMQQQQMQQQQMQQQGQVGPYSQGASGMPMSAPPLGGQDINQSNYLNGQPTVAPFSSLGQKNNQYSGQP